MDNKTVIYNKSGAPFHFNVWDVLAFLVIGAVFAVLAYGAGQMSNPFDIGQSVSIGLSPQQLPFFGLQSVIRMLLALGLSTVFTFIVGTVAAKHRHAERLLVPLIDILQSVPVLGYLSITVSFFISLFPGSLLGSEMCCIFVLFTAQVWNMTLGFYQSLKTLPDDLSEAARMFNLNAWQKFWRIEVPFAMPSLIWNMMMSMSQSWVFLVFNEAIQVAGTNIKLPGIGSYIFVAIEQGNILAIIYAIIAMFAVICIYDQLMFRPLLSFAEKFKTDKQPDETSSKSWLLLFLRKTTFQRQLVEACNKALDKIINIRLPIITKKQSLSSERSTTPTVLTVVYYAFVIVVGIISVVFFSRFVFSKLGWSDLAQVLLLTLYSAARVVAAVVISALIWVPIGVYIGRSKRLTKIIQPIVQFCAAFPANLIYPIMVMLVISLHLNFNIFSTVLIIIGAQWYILFNVISGAAAISKDIYFAADNFRVVGWLRWQRVILPGLFPYLLTGAVTAAGGAWNLTIVAELVRWGKQLLSADGVGSYITHFTNTGDFQRIALGIVVMCLFVLLFNWLLWRPLYNLAEEKYRAV